MVARLLREEEAQTLVEYGLIVSLIALVVIAILTILGTKIRNLFVRTSMQLTSTS